MADLECPRCDCEFMPDVWPYGDDVECPQCHAVLETDWEESGDCLMFWVTGEKEEPDEPPAICAGCDLETTYTTDGMCADCHEEFKHDR